MKEELKDIISYIPIIFVLAYILLLADKTAKIGVFGTMITLLINTDNYELKYKKKISESTKLKILKFKNIALTFYCSCYITGIVNIFITNATLHTVVNLVFPSIFFLIIWLYVQKIIPTTIDYMEKNRKK
ncbi:hypothetical protein JZO78_12835 [Enterococcus ureilyticus]|uniref:hypothetical protein n=1 Tax=Enterococcus ureilyticus TaxID=1131292 RepID=UPI001A92B350|nr:hypothetical protein [Enterococcus ureilyticus]MBO0447229.1 hypothetical protein [Enterococcus ureilyticus]